MTFLTSGELHQSCARPSRRHHHTPSSVQFLNAQRTASYSRSTWSNEIFNIKLRACSRNRRINRYYDPRTGQFISVDPALTSTGTPYSYGGDNPINSVDFFGLKGWSCVHGVSVYYKFNLNGAVGNGKCTAAAEQEAIREFVCNGSCYSTTSQITQLYIRISDCVQVIHDDRACGEANGSITLAAAISAGHGVPKSVMAAGAFADSIIRGGLTSLAIGAICTAPGVDIACVVEVGLAVGAGLSVANHYITKTRGGLVKAVEEGVIGGSIKITESGVIYFAGTRFNAYDARTLFKLGQAIIRTLPK